MKIICSTCRKALGVQQPYNDDSEIPAKCPDCFQKEKEEALKLPPLPAPGERKDITLENGFKGFLAVAGAGAEKLSLSELIVSGKKIICAKDYRESFYEYLQMREGDYVDVTFLYFSSTKIPPNIRKRKKQPSKEEKPQSIDYNCTVTVPKYYALMMFDKSVEQQKRFLDIIVKALDEEWEKECSK